MREEQPMDYAVELSRTLHAEICRTHSAMAEIKQALKSALPSLMQKLV